MSSWAQQYSDEQEPAGYEPDPATPGDLHDGLTTWWTPIPEPEGN